VDDIDSIIVDHHRGAIALIELVDRHPHPLLGGPDRLAAHRAGTVDHEGDIERRPLVAPRRRVGGGDPDQQISLAARVADQRPAPACVDGELVRGHG